MEFELTQRKFQYMLEKLIVFDIFSSSILSIKNNKLFSIQREANGNALRFIKFLPMFFDNINGDDESILIDIKKIHKMIKGIPSTAKLNVKTLNEKLIISGDGINFVINYDKPNTEVMLTLPFGFIGSYPIVSEEKIILDVSFKIKLSDFKTIADYANKLKTNIYKFYIGDKGFMVRVGDLHDFSDYVTLSPEVDIKDGNDLEAIFGFGLKQMSKTFDNDITVCTKTNCAGWFYEVGKEHVLGILVPPCIREET